MNTRKLYRLLINKVTLAFVGPLVVFSIWHIIYSFSLFKESLLPSPISALDELSRMVYTGNILRDLIESLTRMLIGYFIAAVIGIIAGLVIGKIKFLYQTTESTIDFFRSIPVTTLYPIFVLMFGIDHISKIAMVFWASVFVITLNSAYGVIHSNKIRYQMSKLYGASKTQILRWVVFYDALPQSLIGLRVALSLALIVEILCEMFMGSKYGLGQRITEAFTTYATSELYALVIISGLVGYGLNRIFVFFEKKIVPWKFYD